MTTDFLPRNPLLRAVLAAVALLRRPIGSCRIDHRKFTALLAAFLVLDERRGQRREGRASSAFGAGYAWTCFFNLLIGGFSGLALFLEDPVLGLGINQGVVLLFTILILMTDYSAVLLDDTDVALVAPLPVDDRTFFAARVAHIAAYLGVSVGCLALPGLVLGCFALPVLPFAPLYLLSSFLTGLLGVALAFGFFVLAMRMFDLERFKDLLLWVQIATTVLFVAGFQLLSHLLDLSDIESVLGRHPWVAIAFPSCHQGGLLALALGEVSDRNLVLGGLALGLPVLAFLLLLELAARGFFHGLAGMAAGARSAMSLRARRSSVRDRWLRDPTSRAGFDFFGALSRRERNYRLRTYPMIAFALVFGLIFALRGGTLESGLLCMPIYILGLYVPLFLIQARYSENWEGRWILEVSPLEHPGRFASGAMVAMAWTLFLPMFAFLLTVVLLIGGPEVLPDTLFATLGMLVLGGVSARWLGRILPFTEKPSKSGSEGSFAIFLGLSLVVGLIGALHALLRVWTPVFVLATVAMGAGLWVTWRSLRRLRVPSFGGRFW